MLNRDAKFLQAGSAGPALARWSALWPLRCYQVTPRGGLQSIEQDKTAKSPGEPGQAVLRLYTMLPAGTWGLRSTP